MKLTSWGGSRPSQIVFWIALLFAFAMAINPLPPEIPGEPNDKVEHIIAFATLTILGSIAYPRASWIRLLVGLSLFGALIEFVQAIPILHRDAELLDWVADTVAVGSILAIIYLWRSRA